MHRTLLRPCGNPGSTFLRVRLSDYQACPAAPRRSTFRHHLLRDVNASAVLFVPGSRRFGLNRDLDFHASVLQTPRISEYSQQHFTVVPPFFFVSSPNAAARHHRIVAHDVFSRSRVETEPATVRPVHSEFLLWSSGLVWLEQDLLTERCDLLIDEWFPSDALMSCHTVARGMSSTSMLHDVQAISKLSCQDQSSHQSVVQCSP